MSLMGRHTLGFLDWATGGSLLVFDVDKRIGTVDTAGTEARTFADANPRDEYWSNDWVYSYHADVSPDGSRIVYVTCEFPFPHSGYGYPPGYELAIVNIDGTGLQRLTIDGRFTAYPAWSPGGRRIAFIRTEPTDSDYRYADPRYYHPFESQIVILSERGTKRVFGTKGVGMYPPVWSPDGERLAFLVNQPAEGEKDPYRPRNQYAHILFQIRPDGSGGSRLGEATTLPTWSPDGERLAFGLEDEVYTVRLDGTDRRLVVDDFRANQVSWSPDGTELLLASDGGVHVVGADGSGLRKLGPSNLGVKSAIWSSDGSTIAARHELDDEPLVFTMNRDGTDVRFLASATVDSEEEISLQPSPEVPSAYRDPETCEADHFFGGDESNPGLIEDCKALLRAWNSIVPKPRRGNPIWNWGNIGMRIGEWDGVDVCGDPPRVRALRLQADLVFTPRDLGELTALEALDLSFNNLTHIPLGLANLTTLKELYLSGNNLRGPIPSELGNLTMLETLYLGTNSLTGPVPPELGNLTKLKGLYLGHNNLTGPIPPELGNLTKLKELGLSANSLTGPIPPELGNLTMLDGLYLGRNNLTGPIPPELGNLTMLKKLYLSYNGLTGSIPPSFGQLAMLEELVLRNNDLAGRIPPELRNLRKLEVVSLGFLIGCIPPELPQVWVEQSGLERCKPEGEDGS